MDRERHHPTHWLFMVTTAALLVGAARRWRVVVTGESMSPAFQAGDRLLLLPFLQVQPGDVVAVPDPRVPSRLLIKRVAGRDGDLVDVRGDHEAASTDSRHFGMVPLATVAGRAVYRYAPAGRVGWVGRRGRRLRGSGWGRRAGILGWLFGVC